jgi:hypothetical protein
MKYDRVSASQRKERKRETMEFLLDGIMSGYG